MARTRYSYWTLILEAHILILFSAISCNIPPTFPNAVSTYVTGDTLVFDTTLTYTCANGYKIKDQNTNQQDLRCLPSSGSVSWESTIIECEGILSEKIHYYITLKQLTFEILKRLN